MHSKQRSLRGVGAGLRVVLGSLVLIAVLPTLGCDGAAEPSSSLPRGEGFNVLLISMDTTRADHLACYGHPSIKTPNIDRLAAEGTMFARCATVTPITFPSHASMLTGTYPYVHGGRDNGRNQLPEENETLAEFLKAAGHVTAAEVAAYVLNHEFGMNQGFDVYNDTQVARGRDEDPSRLAFTERYAEEVCDSTLEWLREHAGERFFLFVHFFDPHQPYEPPPRFMQQYGSRYLGEIAYVDEQIGRLLAELQALGLDERTLLLLTSDHGEGLGQHAEDTHGAFVYESTLRVPLIVRSPGRIPAGQTVNTPVSIIDIPPTIVAFLGLPPMADAQGESLLSLIAGAGHDPDRLLYSESLYPMFNYGYSPLRAVRVKGWKYIHAPGAELYHIDKDPGELRNLFSAEPERAAALRQRLYELIKAAPVVVAKADAQREMSPSDVAKLQALGYVGGSAVALAADQSELELLELDRADPKDHIYTINLTNSAIAVVKGGDLEESERVLREVVGLTTGDAQENWWAQASLASVLCMQGKHEEAIPFFRNALRTFPEDGRTLTNVGFALLALGQTDEAIVEFRRALECKPLFATTYHHYAIAQTIRGEFEEAVRLFEEAIALDPTLPHSYSALARVLARSGKLAETVAALSHAVERLPTEPTFRRQLAGLLLNLNQPEAAKVHYEALLRFAPADAVGHAGLGEVYRRLGENQKAVERLRAAVELDDRIATAWRGLGRVLVEQGEYAEAVAAIRTALRRGPVDASLLNNLAWILATSSDDQLRDGAEATKLAEKLCDDEPNEGAYLLDTLAAAYAEVGRFEEAVDTAKRAAAIATQNGQSELAARIQQRLRLYEKSQPYRAR